MKTNDRELKRVYRESVQKASVPTKDCPSPQAIWELFAGKASERRKARLVDHITACPSCFREFEAFLEISRAEGNLANQVQARLGSRPGRAPLPMAWRYVAALLMLMVILATAILSTKWLGPAGPPEERGRVSGQVRLLSPSREPNLRAPLIFSWEEIARSEYFIIEIFDDSLRPFWKSSRLTGRSYELPSPVKEKLKGNQSYFWMLTAFLQDGGRTESALEEFKLAD